MDVFHPHVLNHVPTLDEKLNYFRKCSAEDILGLVTVVISEDRLPLQYLKSLSDEDRTICYRAAMICWAVTQSTMVPREMQFRVVLSDVRNQDCLIAAERGTRDIFSRDSERRKTIISHCRLGDTKTKIQEFRVNFHVIVSSRQVRGTRTVISRGEKG